MISTTTSVIWVALVFWIGQQMFAQDYGMPSEAQIAAATAEILDQMHFPPRPPEELLSRQFFDNYLDSLDGPHLLFLQSDMDEFAWFRPTMAREVRSKGYIWPAHLIYRVGMARLAERRSIFKPTIYKPPNSILPGRNYGKPNATRRHIRPIYEPHAGSGNRRHERITCNRS